jgi:hypothetical protein
VRNRKGQTAPWIRGVIHNNPGTAHDWDFGEAITGWRAIPAAAPASAAKEPTP